jgi:UDP-glucose 4-epimerase
MTHKKKILVTGGAGYIGSHTVVALIENGFHPIIVDDFRNSKKEVISNLEEITNTKIEYYPIDCCDLNQLKKVFDAHEFSGIIHFAAYKAVGESVEQPINYYQNNLVSLMNVLEMANSHKVQNFVFSSSCTVYGDPIGEIEVDENTPLQTPSSPYGKTKMMSEHILEDFHFANPTSNIYALRYFNPIGAHESAKIGELPIGKPNNLVPFITQSVAGIQGALTVFGNDYPTKDGTCIRDFINVQDLADAHVASLRNLITKNGFFDFLNLGTGKGTSVQELIDVFEKVTGEKVNYTIGEKRLGDVVAIYANVAKVKKELNWEAKKTLEESLLSAWNWQKKLM